MNIADHLTKFLIKKGVTEVFGIPGGVVLEFLYALNRQKKKIKCKLNFHEQNSVFAANGYARTSGKLGVAYATRGPGVTNMMTAITDAYHDSVPLLIITGHSIRIPNNKMRIYADQEIDTKKIFSGITKYCARIDDYRYFRYELEKACYLALNNRKGPVLLDLNINLLNKKINFNNLKKFKIKNKKTNFSYQKTTDIIVKKIKLSKRPVFLIGDGARYVSKTNDFMKFFFQKGIPIISSRFSQDIFANSKLFFGYIGTHGLRHANFILSKSDLIISLGNRMLFLNYKSKSFSEIFNKKSIIRIEIDKAELSRKIKNCININLDISKIMLNLLNKKLNYIEKNKWINDCKKIKLKLDKFDLTFPITKISNILKILDKNYTIVSDVGNNEYWLSKAYNYSKCRSEILYSKSFGAMGCSIGKAIGAFYGTRKPVIAFIGDQSLQMNIQELQYFTNNQIPVVLIILNNFSSGMIRSRQKLRYGEKFLHTTLETGYSLPSFKSISKAYKVKYHFINNYNIEKIKKILLKIKKPIILELKISSKIEAIPFLPKGEPIQKLKPLIKNKIFNTLEEI